MSEPDNLDLCQVSKLDRQAAKLVVGEEQLAKIDQLANAGWQALQDVLLADQRLKTLPFRDPLREL